MSKEMQLLPSGGNIYPYPEEVLNREYGRLMLKYRNNPHHVNMWKSRNGKEISNEQKVIRNKFLHEIWNERPDEWVGLKARMRLGVEDIMLDTFYNVLKRKNIAERTKARLGVK